MSSRGTIEFTFELTRAEAVALLACVNVYVKSKRAARASKAFRAVVDELRGRLRQALTE